MEACSTYITVTLAGNKLSAMQHSIKMKHQTDPAKRDKTQILNDVNEQHFEQNNFQARKDSDMSLNVRRWNDRGGNRKRVYKRDLKILEEILMLQSVKTGELKMILFDSFIRK
jgi:hypothetical protein